MFTSVSFISRLYLSMDKSSSAKWLLYGDVVKGEPSPTGRGRRSRDEKGNQGVGDILFTNILQLFSIYFFFSITLLYHLYPILFHPRHLPTPTPTTHDPRPTTFNYTPLRGVKRRTALCLLSAFRPRLFAPLFIWVCAFDRELVNH